MEKSPGGFPLLTFPRWTEVFVAGCVCVLSPVSQSISVAGAVLEGDFSGMRWRRPHAIPEIHFIIILPLWRRA